MKTYFAFDLETTGVDVANDEPVEISYAIVRDGLTIRPMTFLVNTEREIHEKAQAVHGISKEEARFGVRPATLTGILYDLFSQDDIDGIIAFNGFKFDVPMLLNFMRRHNGRLVGESPSTLDKVASMEIEDPALWYLAENVFHKPRPASHVDCALIAREWVPKGTKFNLGHLCSLYGVEHISAHSAQGDLLATVDLWRKMKQPIGH